MTISQIQENLLFLQDTHDKLYSILHEEIIDWIDLYDLPEVILGLDDIKKEDRLREISIATKSLSNLIIIFKKSLKKEQDSQQNICQTF